MTPTSPFPSRGPSACAGPWRGLHVLHTHGEERGGRGCVNKSSSVCVYSATEGARVVLRRLGGGGALQVCVRGIWSLTHIGAVVEVYILASAPFVHRCRTLLYMGYRCKACRSRSSHDQLVQHCARARSPQEGISTSLWRILDPRKTREIQARLNFSLLFSHLQSHLHLHIRRSHNRDDGDEHVRRQGECCLHRKGERCVPSDNAAPCSP